MNRSSRTEYRTGFIRRYLVLFLTTALGFLLQGSLMPYVRIFGVTPNLLYAVISIVTVAYGKLRAFWVGLVYGFLTEISLLSIRDAPFLNLAVYPLTTLFVSFAFADKPLQRIEMDRAMNRKTKELPAWLRTLLCAAVNISVYEVINLIYVFLKGYDLTSGHIFRALTDVAATTALTALIMFPVRRAIFGKKVIVPVLKNDPIVFAKK